MEIQVPQNSLSASNSQEVSTYLRFGQEKMRVQNIIYLCCMNSGIKAQDILILCTEAPRDLNHIKEK